MTSLDLHEVFGDEFLEERLLICNASPAALRGLGQIAYINGQATAFDAIQQVCFVQSMEGVAAGSVDYARVYTFLDSLVGEEITISD